MIDEKIADDDIEIEIENEEEQPEADVKVEKAEEEPKKPVQLELSIDEGINDLKAKLERERLARIEAEARAKKEAERAAKATSEVEDSNLNLVKNAIAMVNRENEILKSQYSEALAVGDHEKAAEINLQMTGNSAKLMQLENGKTQLENRAKMPFQPVLDPVDQFASQLSKRSAEWVRSHPEYVTDPRLHNKMLAAHQLAVSDGLEADSDEYFETVERVLNIRSAPREEAPEPTMSAASQPTQRRSSPPPAAPVSRAPLSNSGTRPDVVRLTAAEREMARLNGMTEKEYARNKIALIKEGKING